MSTSNRRRIRDELRDFTNGNRLTLIIVAVSFGLYQTKEIYIIPGHVE